MRFYCIILFHYYYYKWYSWYQIWLNDYIIKWSWFCFCLPVSGSASLFLCSVSHVPLVLVSIEEREKLIWQPCIRASASLPMAGERDKEESSNIEKPWQWQRCIKDMGHCKRGIERERERERERGIEGLFKRFPSNHRERHLIWLNARHFFAVQCHRKCIIDKKITKEEKWIKDRPTSWYRKLTTGQSYQPEMQTTMARIIETITRYFY